MDKRSSLGMPMSPQDIFKKYKRQSLGMPKASPSSSTKHQVISPGTIFLSLHILCVILGASVVFVFSLVCLMQLVVSFYHICLGRETHSVFMPRTLQFSLLLFCECSLLLILCLALVFHSYVVKILLVFLVYFVFRFFVVRLLDSMREFLLCTCFK